MPIPSSFQVIPVLDLRQGQVVRAVRGERSAYRPIVTPLAQGSEPCDIARALLAKCGMASQGGVLYVADLDAIQGGEPQLSSLHALLAMRSDLTLWVDAGFTSAQAAKALRSSLGDMASRVRPVYGSESLATAGALDELALDPQAILSLDSRLAKPMDPSGAWQRPHAWPRTMIVMTLDRVGSDSGPDLGTFERLRAQAQDRVWIGAGGVRDESDLKAAAQAGASGWLVASALHEGRLALE
jgi:phosphoribosylformimino-5-aminoimidazole carboxamide ribotide isomerase